MQNNNLTAITIARSIELCKKHNALSESSDFDTIGNLLYVHDRPAYNYFMQTDHFDLIGETVFALYFGLTDDAGEFAQFDTDD